jgi:uncharacterized membrane protein
MPNLIAAAAAFVLIHFLISGTRVRDGLIARLGEGPYLGLFSLGSALILTWLGFAYGGARNDPGNHIVWMADPAMHYVQLVIQFFAVFLIVVGLTTPNPTSVKQEGVLERPEAVRGILRVTRHPFLWGVALWALGHLLVNGDAASLILFGSMLGLALFGTAGIDAKRRRLQGPKWEPFAGQTSNVPFLAIAQGRQRFSLGEMGWWRVALAVGIWIALAYGHPYIFGVVALP